MCSLAIPRVSLDTEGQVQYLYFLRQSRLQWVEKYIILLVFGLIQLENMPLKDFICNFLEMVRKSCATRFQVHLHCGLALGAFRQVVLEILHVQTQIRSPCIYVKLVAATRVFKQIKNENNNSNNGNNNIIILAYRRAPTSSDPTRLTASLSGRQFANAPRRQRQPAAATPNPSANRRGLTVAGPLMSPFPLPLKLLLVTVSLATALHTDIAPPMPRYPVEIRAAVVLPAESKYITSLSKVRPVLDIAVRDLYAAGVLRETEVTFKFVEKDDKCEDIEAIRSSFDLILNGRVDLFLGPTCDYGVGQWLL